MSNKLPPCDHDECPPTHCSQQSEATLPAPKLFGDFIRKHNLAVETLTEQQLAEAIRQAIAAGDLMRHVVADGRQTVVYIPWREVERLRGLYNELLYAVERKHDYETSHETALRYIREREADKTLSAHVEATLPTKLTDPRRGGEVERKGNDGKTN